MTYILHNMSDLSHHQCHMVSSEPFSIWAGEIAQRLQALAVAHTENHGFLLSSQNPFNPSSREILYPLLVSWVLFSCAHSQKHTNTSFKKQNLLKDFFCIYLSKVTQLQVLKILILGFKGSTYI